MEEMEEFMLYLIGGHIVWVKFGYMNSLYKSNFCVSLQFMTIDLIACAILLMWLHLNGMIAYNNNKEWKNSGN